MHSPDLGLLLDIDGPIASPVTRSIRIPSIASDLVALVGAGVPIAFITGRSDHFIRESVVGALLRVGLADALSTPGARMFGVFEKGGSWAPITADGMGEVTVDPETVLPADAMASLRELVQDGWARTMFFDETKCAMVSVEQSTAVAHAEYVAAQPGFQDAAWDLLTASGLGLRYGERESPDASGRIPFRIDPTVISTDIESVLLDKDRGAERALAYFGALGALPAQWRTVGDSRSDYLMADQLHAMGYEVAHVDVRPADGVLTRDYPVLVEGELVHDDAGAAFLARCRAELNG